MTSVVYVADRRMPSFQTARLSADVVCAGDSITGWNNFGVVRDWPYRTYPEFLQRFCDPLGLTIANGGIAGEVSPNGLGQVRDYLDLFPNARYFVVGYGTNDLGMWPQVERTSPRIIENLAPDGAGDPGQRKAADPLERAVCERVDVPPEGCRGSAPHEGLPQRASDSALPGEPRSARRYCFKARG